MVVEQKLKKQVFIRTLFGQTYQDLVKLPLNELSKNLTSRARRKINRGLSPTEKLLKAKCEKKQLSKAKGHKVLPIKTHCRSMPILPCMVGLTLAPYNGLFYDPFEVKLDHVGMKLGEFSFTYKFVTHKRMGKGATSGSKHVALK